jgi:hypothetical protein
VTHASVLQARVPADMLVLIAAVALGGTAAGFLAAAPVLFVTTPVVACGLALGAALGGVPEWQRLARAFLDQLPDGQARMLLEDLVRRASAVPAAAHVEPLVAAACEAARQLSALEIHLAAFEAQRDSPGDKSARWHDALQRCQRGAALLAHRLQDAGAALSRWQAAQGAGESLGQLARDLNDESRCQSEAAQEVEALLA